MKQQISILLLEDNQDDYELLEEILLSSEEIEAIILRKTRLDESLYFQRDTPVDVAIVDLNLPDSYGIDTFLRFRESNPNLPVVVMTGNSDRETAIRAVHQGAQDYLFKGKSSENTIVRTILYAIERNKLRAALKEKSEQLEQANTQLKISAQFLQSTLDGQASSIAVLDDQGTIIQVNKTWYENASHFGFEGFKISDRSNYFHVCEHINRTQAPNVDDLIGGLHEVLEGEVGIFSIESPSYQSGSSKWFISQVTGFINNLANFAIVSHQDITSRKEAENRIHDLLQEKELILKEKKR